MNGSEEIAAGAEPSVGLDLPQTTPNGIARRAALASPAGERRPTSLVAYKSAGSVLIIGDAQATAAAADRLKGRLPVTVLLTDGADGDVADPTEGGTRAGNEVRSIQARIASVHGHLGAFGVKALVKGEEVDLAPSLITAHKPFDIVLDLDRTPWIRSEVRPPGYFAPADSDALEQALEEIPEMVGEFEKPRYFNYDASICAHGNSGLIGCTRCLEACPTDAIRSLKDAIEVDPYLCQGGGSCATACPTGAITYAFPRAADLLDGLRRLLGAYRDAGGQSPVVLFHDGEAGRAWLETSGPGLPENVIPVEVEEIGSVGMDAWLSLIAYGARQVVLWCPASMPRAVSGELDHQVGVARTILEGMGYPDTLLLRADESETGWIDALSRSETPDIPVAGFAAVDEKRTNIRAAVDHLYESADERPKSIPLPAGAPFGELAIDKKACTLCMACVSVCPASALNDGGEEPKLKFIEWNCVQCGLCETACPEDAITRLPRFLFDAEQRRAARVINEDAPFHCVSCGKAFATTRVIQRMRDKLKDHWMFQKPEAVRRMEMCEDCRVKDMFKDGGGLLDVHGDS
ncbi:MAG: 4Fe-4S binding protein [Gammaproteobacteria bacterium]|nr:4Fe-4S binding protein [Gammaproteobacteria bacterium]